MRIRCTVLHQEKPAVRRHVRPHSNIGQTVGYTWDTTTTTTTTTTSGYHRTMRSPSVREEIPGHAWPPAPLLVRREREVERGAQTLGDPGTVVAGTRVDLPGLAGRARRRGPACPGQIRAAATGPGPAGAGGRCVRGTGRDYSPQTSLSSCGPYHWDCRGFAPRAATKWYDCIHGAPSLPEKYGTLDGVLCVALHNYCPVQDV